MDITRLKRLKNSAISAADSYRGIDMETFSFLMRAADSIDSAIKSAEKIKASYV